MSSTHSMCFFYGEIIHNNKKNINNFGLKKVPYLELCIRFSEDFFFLESVMMPQD